MLSNHVLDIKKRNPYKFLRVSYRLYFDIGNMIEQILIPKFVNNKISLYNA